MQFLPEKSGEAAAWSRSAQEAAAWRVGFLRDGLGLDSIAGDWDALAASRSPMEHFGWARAAAECLHGSDRLSVATLEEGGRLRAIAPLVERRAPLPLFEVAGAARLGEPVEFLCESREAQQRLLHALHARRTPLFIPRVFEDGGLLADVRAAYGKGIVLTRPASGCARVELDDSWLEPERKLSRSRRKDLNQRRRVAESIGPIRCETVAPDARNLPALLEETYRVEQASWKGKTGSALSLDEPLGRFFRQYAAWACDRGMLRLLFLRIGEQAVAMEIAVECAQTLWGLKIGYDERFRQCAPGLLLTVYALGYAAGRGLKYREFLGSVESWQLTLTRNVRRCVSLHAYPLAPLSLAQFGWHAAAWSLRRLRGGPQGKQLKEWA